MSTGCPKPTTGPATTEACHLDAIEGEWVASISVVPNYTPKDQGETIAGVRAWFLDRLTQDLAGSGIIVREAQGEAHDMAISISVDNDGYDNLNLSIYISPVPARGTWGRAFRRAYTYTDPFQMVNDYADDVAASLRYGQDC